MGYRIGIDTGGTFTDVVAIDEANGQIHSTKTATVPDDPSQGVLEGVRKILRQIGAEAGAVVSISHGTTVATNALLRDEFPGLGLVTTAGFRNILEIARQSVPQGYGNSYFWVKPERIVPLHHVREVPERLNFRGEVLREFDEQAAIQAARWFKAQGLTSIGVCFLHSYANPDHERRMRDVLRREYPEAWVSISSDVLPEYREYERTVTTLVDAFVKPRVATYIERIQQRVQSELGSVPFFVMKSNGGVISAAEVPSQAVTTVLSGPAAGALGAAYLAQAAGLDRVLTLDGGGTSTDVGLVEHGQPRLTTEGQVGRFPVKVPMIDIVTIGTGGGSIAWRSADGALRIGPRSAGANPGPMCYDRGGAEPTVTDAAVLLGRIPPSLLGGEISLSLDRARAGLAALAGSLEMDAEALAEGILEISAWNQANAIRQVSVRRGLAPADYTLVAFGGSGPLLAGQLVDILGLDGALVPPNPGNVSAFGLQVVDLRNDYVLTRVQRHDQLDLALVNRALEELETRARDALGREGYQLDRQRLVRSADLRYFGQAFEVRVDLPAGTLDADAADQAVRRFHDAHQRVYGYSYPDLAVTAGRNAVEWVNLRVSGIGPISRPEIRRLDAAAVPASPATKRDVRFDGRWLATPVYQRASLGPGDILPGPIIVEDCGATTVVNPGLAATVDDWGNLFLKKSHG